MERPTRVAGFDPIAGGRFWVIGDSGQRPAPPAAQADQAGELASTAGEGGSSAQVELVTAADFCPAEARVSGRPPDADLPRGHLPCPLRAGPRHPAQGVDQATAAEPLRPSS